MHEKLKMYNRNDEVFKIIINATKVFEFPKKKKKNHNLNVKMIKLQLKIDSIPINYKSKNIHSDLSKTYDK